MSTAWEILVAQSTLPVNNTAWAHLNAQEGGGGGQPINGYAYSFRAASMAIAGTMASVSPGVTLAQLQSNININSLASAVSLGTIEGTFNGA